MSCKQTQLICVLLLTAVILPFSTTTAASATTNAGIPGNLGGGGITLEAPGGIPGNLGGGGITLEAPGGIPGNLGGGGITLEAPGNVTSRIHSAIPDHALLPRSLPQDYNEHNSSDLGYDVKQWRHLMWYVSVDHPDNEWNKNMVKEHIRINNFDTIIGNHGHGHELVALVASKQQISGNYSHPTPVIKYHEWAKSQYVVPDTVQEIDEKITEIAGTDRHSLVGRVYDSYNNMANHGTVHSDLFESDEAYWTMIINIALCEYTEGCDARLLEHSLAISTINSTAPTTLISTMTNWLDIILPKASASIPVYHYSSLYGGYADEKCPNTECWISISKSGTGEQSLSLSTHPNKMPDHGYGTTFIYQIINCPMGNIVDNRIESTAHVHADAGMGSLDETFYSINACIIEKGGAQAARDPDAGWTWSIYATTHSHMDRNPYS